jgi:protein-tyrosine phosphatase
VALPTETVYGLAANALDENAVHRLRELKERDRQKPLTLAIKSAEEARDYAPDLCFLAQRLARRCWPGPVTLVVDNSHPESLVKRLPSRVIEAVSPQKMIGLRVPGHRIVLDVLCMMAGPLCLTSANRAGMPEATTAQGVMDIFGDRIDLVVDDGPSRFGQPSSVVRVKSGRFEVLRAGVVPERTLHRLASAIVLFVCTGNTCRSPMAEMLCRNMLAKRLKIPLDALDDRGILVMSAGSAAMTGGRATSEAVETMSMMGLELGGHETQPLTETLVRHADLIYVMTRAHREAIVAQWPSAAERVRVLCVDGADVCDPIGGPLDRYFHCAEKIQAELAARLTEIEPLLPLSF